ncbi:MAG TPA: GldG family protein [Polyangiaceae bacterium]|nr:GldG family protein [Polyangiaceae bacterium]
MRLSRSLPWLGVAASALLLVNLNVLGARWYKRWDFTTDKLYTLSEPTRELLRGLEHPVDVQVLLSRSDPLEVSVRHMLDAYGAETQHLRVHYVDPDRNPAQFLAVQQKYQILAGKADDGRVITDAVIVVADGEKHWFLTADELVHLDEDSGRSRPALEQALSSALDNVRRTEKAKICFTVGHREPTLDDAGPQGLSELRQRLLKNNYEVESLDATAPNVSYASCVAVVVATPELEFAADQATRLRDYVKSGGNALLLLSPTTGDGQALRGTGLDPLLELCGVTLGRDVVLEQDKAVRLPQGEGEVFWAKLLPHPITRGVLHEDDKLSSRVLVVQSRSVSVSGNASLILRSSDSAVALRDLHALTESGAEAATSGAAPRSYGLAAAVELPKPASSHGTHGPRVLISGASNLAYNRNFQDPSLYGNRRLLENAISWAAARPSMLSVPAKAEREVGLSLSEESLGDVMRYVLFYMPLSAGLIGAFVLLRRRNDEKRSRQSKPSASGSSS